MQTVNRNNISNYITTLRGEDLTKLCTELLKQEYKDNSFGKDANDFIFVARKKRELLGINEKFNLNLNKIKVN